MLNFIPITPATIDIITKLNEGVRPNLEAEETFYIYRGEDEHADIITREQLIKSDEFPAWMTVDLIHYRG